MPTVAEILRDVRDDINDPATDFQGNPVTTRYTDAQILRKFNRAAGQVARRTLCVKKRANVATVVTQQEYSFPVDYIQIRTMMYRSSAGQIPLELDEIPLADVIDIISGSVPTGFARREDGTFRLNGLPESALANGIEIDYYALPAAVSAASAPTFDVPERYHDVVEQRTAALMLAGPDEEPGKAGDINALYEQSAQEALDREKEASHYSPGRVRDAYNPLTGTYGVRR